MYWKQCSFVTFIFALCLTVPAVGAPFDRAGLNGPCVADSETLCLNNGQFALRVAFDDGEKTSGPGQVLLTINDMSGFFYLDDDRHLELFAQVLDGCDFTNHYWVVLMGLSAYAQTVTIEEAGSVVKTYDNPAGEFFGVTDTMAFPCVPSADSETPSNKAAVSGQQGGAPQPLVLDRFEITTEFEDFTMTTGDGQPVEVADLSGYFWFFNPENPDVIVKMVDNGDVNGNFWLFFGSQTTVAYDLHIVDTCSGNTVTFSSPLGVAAGTVFDTSSFPSVSECQLFTDGFESGDTTAWSDTVGLPE